ncbi:hypothetical protein HPB48_011346 [Haemaphysalis longicornis]|uniref:Transposable element n=1 Tax=Haemaphysalis longicornis TaxID=44386 RepID=A0A9J6GIL9_HAELO|nr:hypothetical protein HPB48_011346 [Haemaphysalis longicornis]
MKGFKSAFGFNSKVLSALQEKTKEMDEFSRHGGLVFDELKLSENINVKASGELTGFVDLGPFTDDRNKTEASDHGFVVMFQPFQATSKGITCKVPHPVEPGRNVHFISDFPHLIKCIRNAFVSTGLHIPDAHVLVDVVREAWKKDSESLTLKVMPHITQSHVQPTEFVKMKVNLAFQLFSEEVLKEIFLFKVHLAKTFKMTPSPETFLQKMERLIFIMTARIPSKGLKCDSASAKFLEDYLPFLREWEKHAAKHGGGFLSDSTALGLRVTIQSTLSLLSYVTSTLKYTYLLTANLSQDKMENVFGVVRQAFGSNDHPSPEQFLVVINNMAFYSLARPAKGGNSPPELVTALLEPCDVPEQKGARVTALVDSLLDEGNLPHAKEVLERHASLLDHDGMVEKKSDSRVIFYIAG